MDTMISFVCCIKNGKLCAIDPSRGSWIPACADWLLKTGNMLKVR